ncbi:MAG: ABC transporter substrate-binding protein [Candidatus Thorarchaeota archaeon]
MKRSQFQMFLVVWIVPILIFSEINPVHSLNIGSEYSLTSPYVNSVVYEVISDPDERLLAIEQGSVDAALGSYESDEVLDIERLEANSNIDIHMGSPRYGNGYLVINCAKYPFNISGFRRAFAYAFNKTLASEVQDGFSTEHDSVIPLPSKWCYEDGLPWHYYSAQADLGNSILDSLGFTIDEGTGFRLAPDDSPFDIIINHFPSQFPEEIAILGVEALKSLHINATNFATYETEVIMNSKEDFDMGLIGRNFLSEDDLISWLVNEFWSGVASSYAVNLARFSNTSFDSWRNQLLHGTTFEEVYEAASEMQKILHYNIPVLVMYNHLYLQAYRSDTFTGYVEDLRWGISGLWSNLEVHNKVGSPFGGSFKVAIETAPDTFNLYKVDQESEEVMMDILYPSLYRIGPDMMQYPDLATNLLIETSTTNPSVPAGQLWMTLDIRQDAVWSTGVPLTADDVNFTFTYVRQGGNPLASELAELVSTEVLSPYSVRLVFASEEYWDYEAVFNTKIIPKHIFETETGIIDWNTWNPVFDSLDPLVTCGPFYLSSHDSSTFTFTRNVNYYAPTHSPVVLTTDNVTYVEGQIGNYIMWTVDDDDPANYIISKDDVIQVTYVWNESDISYNVDGLPVGMYKFTLTLEDESLNQVTSIVWVTVTATPILPIIIGTAIGSSAIIIGAGVLIMRKRRR